ncbi:hypothetical protein C8R44DRAFT_868879 [Mycena epipterygia]|nr:hypothetical protein C8R44DRAFT_868879 [Mycena epipterygia]
MFTRTQSVSIHRAAAHLSKAQFEQKMDDFMDAFIEVPAVKKNALKIEMLVPKSNMDMHVQAIGLPAPHPTVIILCEWESQEKMLATASDTTLIKMVAGGIADFGLDAGSCVFHSNITAKINISTPSDSVLGFSIHPVPAHMSKAQFEQKMEAHMDAFISVPLVKKNAPRVEMMVQSTTLDTDVWALHIKGLGLPEPHPTVLILTYWESEEQVIEVMNDATIKKLAAHAIPDASLDIGSCTGIADVVAKINKTN